MKQQWKLWFALLALTACFATVVTIHASKRIACAPATREAIFGAAPFDTKQTYDSKCATCHGKDGRAKSLHAKHVHARDFTDASWQSDVSDERLFNSISNGKGKMPAFKKKLSDDQIDALVKYVRQLKR